MERPLTKARPRLRWRRARRWLRRAGVSIGGGALALGLTHCGPKVAAGPTVAEISSVAPEVRIEPSAERVLGVRLLAGGSRWDAPGLEGSTAAALLAAAREHDLQLQLGRDRSALWLRCDGPAAPCAERLRAALLRPSPPLDPDDPLHPAPTLVDRALQVIFEGHPYQHPPSGPLATRAVLAQHHLDEARERFGRRSIVQGFVSSADLAPALRDALAGLPATPAPDPAMMGPPRPARSRLIVLRSKGPTYGVAIAGAPARSPLAPSHAALSPDEQIQAAGVAASACARDLLQTAAMSRSTPTLAPPLDHAAVVVAFEQASRLEIEQLVAELPHAWPLLRVDAQRICPESVDLLHAAWPERTLTVLVRWPEEIEDPWRADVPPAGYDHVYRPRLLE